MACLVLPKEQSLKNCVYSSDDLVTSPNQMHLGHTLHKKILHYLEQSTINTFRRVVLRRTANIKKITHPFHPVSISGYL